MAGEWQRLWREAITEPSELLRLLGLESLAANLSEPARASFALRVPRGYAARMRAGDPADPLLRQVLPVTDEDRIVEGFGIDAVGDLAARESHGLLHKYAGRALLITTGSCAIHCRYCFRRHFPYADETASSGRFAEALQWLDAHRGIDEVILSGGDPLSLSDQRLAELASELAARPWIRRLRIHTRLPIVLPQRVDAALLAWISALPMRCVMVVHANHAQELDEPVARACADLARAGCTLLNQAVLLRGVNDSVDIQQALCERLFDCGVLPYYLHQLDRVSGTAHFEVDDAFATVIIKELRARLPGYLVPQLVREIAGQTSKTPLS